MVHVSGGGGGEVWMRDRGRREGGRGVRTGAGERGCDASSPEAVAESAAESAAVVVRARLRIGQSERIIWWVVGSTRRVLLVQWVSQVAAAASSSSSSNSGGGGGGGSGSGRRMMVAWLVTGMDRMFQLCRVTKRV